MHSCNLDTKWVKKSIEIIDNNVKWLISLILPDFQCHAILSQSVLTLVLWKLLFLAKNKMEDGKSVTRNVYENQTFLIKNDLKTAFLVFYKIMTADLIVVNLELK